MKAYIANQMLALVAYRWERGRWASGEEKNADGKMMG